MHKLYELKEKLMRELEDYADNGKFSKDDVEAIKYTASAIDHICNIVEDADEYSEAMEGGMGGSYMGGMSYARGGRGGNRGGRGGRTGANQYGSYARGGGYSRNTDNMVMELRELMNDAEDERTRSEIHGLIKRLEQM